MNVLDNPNFIQWFGQSKIKDKEGYPIVCYKFVPKETNSIEVPNGLEQKAIFLTYSKKAALLRGGNVVPLYVKMEMPFDISNRKKSRDYIEWRLKHNTMESVIDYAKRTGRDGIINNSLNELMVFTSNQVKSADKNNGEFSIKSNNLYESSAIPEIDPYLIDTPISKKIINQYEITDEPLDAFFILADGQLLDGSGRNIGNRNGGRILDHHEIGSFVKLFQDNYHKRMLYAMKRSGAIRLDAKIGYIATVGRPNGAQIRAILNMFHGKEIRIDYYSSSLDWITGQMIPATKEQLEWFFKYPLDPLSQYTEMAYPAGFSMETLLSFSSYSDRIKYANKNLEYINHGSSRTVFGVDEKKVLKVARNDRGLAQNGAEVRFSKKQIPICARVFKWADDNSFIEMERAEPIDDMAIFEYGTGITSMFLFHEYLGELSYREDKVNIKGFTDNPWVQELVKFAKDNKYELPGDFTTLSAYGIVHRKEGWRVVIIDYGFTPSVHNDYY
jgi:hypothetical protein